MSVEKESAHGKSTSRPDHRRRRFWAWLSGISTVVIAALVVSFLQGGPSPYEKTIAKSLHLSAGTPKPSNLGQPVLVNSVTVMPSEAASNENDDSYAFPNSILLSKPDLATLSKANYLQFDNWLDKNGGAVIGYVSIQIVVSGNRPNVVRILGMQAQSVVCAAPMHGTLMATVGAGPQFSQPLGFDLSKGDTIAQAYSPTKGFGADYFRTKTIALNHGEQETFQVFAQSLKRYCHFTIGITVLDGQRRIVETIKNGAEPFKVTGGLPEKDYRVEYATAMCEGDSPYYQRVNPKDSVCGH